MRQQEEHGEKSRKPVHEGRIGPQAEEFAIPVSIFPTESTPESEKSSAFPTSPRPMYPRPAAAALLISLAAPGLAERPPVPPPNDFTPQPQVPFLSPEDFLKTVELPDGYSLELVLAEPTVREPVAIAFDPNGAMYVAEMRTYMQDIDGKDQITPRSLVSKHVSSKGDGVFDRHSTYLDKVLLPRMILPLDDRVLIGITNTLDLTIHRDADGDGVADESKPWFVGGPRGGNLEHQPSGLVWGLDNWIYTTYNSFRLRWNGEGAVPLKEPTPSNGGQWGLAQDDHGKMWWSNAGGEKGLWSYQVPIVYGAINTPSQKEKDFDVTWPLAGVRDYQGGPRKSREDGTLNHFTGCAGQTVYRGDRLPEELRGNVFLPEPVGRLIRRAVVSDQDGLTVLSNPHPKSEFLRSTDLCFRPLNMTTGPDGCLYIVDMYRGIIQEGNWVREGSYLRKVVEQHGFAHNVGRGRVWRLVHKDFKPGPQPRMLEESPARWVDHLAHPNGWWRDTAQRLIIVKGDRSVVPALEAMFRSHAEPLARIHALWTLEGLGALTPELARAGMKDGDPQIRVQAIRASETLLKAGDASFVADIRAATGDDHVHVKLQSLLTAKLHRLPGWQEDATRIVTGSVSPGLREIGAALLDQGPAIANNFTAAQSKQLQRGLKIYQEICFACHGPDGAGTPIAGSPGQTLAPPLGGSKTVLQGDAMLRVLLHGLEGPIEGKTYESQMIPQNTNSDAWLADITSYVRNAFGNSGRVATAEEVAALRRQLAGRGTPWTIEELRALSPQPLANRGEWKLAASHGAGKLRHALDGNPSTRWDTGTVQAPGMWLQVELPAATEVAGIELDCAGSPADSPQAYQVHGSADDGKTWQLLAKGRGDRAHTAVNFKSPVKVTRLRIQQDGRKPGKFWSIHELDLLAPPRAPRG
jgi:mono/diheme cytochrome c family protein